MSRDNLASLVQQLTRIEAKVNATATSLAETVVQTAANTTSLQDHMEQTRILKGEIATRLPPLEKHVAMWAGAGKLLVVMISLAGLVVAILKLVL